MKSTFRSLLFATMAALAVATLPALTACGTGPTSLVASVQGPQAKIGAALATVTEARDLLSLAVAGDKVSADDATNLRAQIQTARQGIDVAQGLFKSDPKGGDARLDAARAAIAGVRTYLLTKGVQ